jgi:hypothetical protein
MKVFTVTKTGYTAGVYGNSGEYFTLIWVNSNGLHSQMFSGQYGAEQRIASEMKSLGYKDYYTHSNYGKLTRKDIIKNTLSEHTMLEMLKSKEYLKNGCVE